MRFAKRRAGGGRGILQNEDIQRRCLRHPRNVYFAFCARISPLERCGSERKRRMKQPESTSPAQPLKKAQPEEFDLVILGGGTGSTIAAWTFAGEGKQVAVVERKYIGGSCPNIACLPSKNIIHSAKVASYFRRSKEFGITHDGFAIDMADVRERKRRMVRGLNDMYMENYRNTGAGFILGSHQTPGHRDGMPR
jgi:hypothetical protein